MQTLTEYLTENRVHSAPVIEYVPTGEIYRGVRALYYDLPAKDAAYRIFSYLALPQSPPPQGGYPAVVLLHGGNGMAYYEVARMWAKRGFAAIAPDLNGFCAQSTARRDVPNPNGGPHGYGTNVRGPHPWAYFSVLSAMRAADVLCSLPEVNADKLCSCGLSWGGWLNLLFAAKERRLKAVSIIYSSAYAWQSGWGAVQTASLSPEERLRFEQADPQSCLAEITAPVFFTAGADDQAFSMENRRRTAAALRVPAFYSLRKSFPHANIYGFEEPESALFCSSVLSGRLPSRLQAVCRDGEISVRGARRGDARSLVCTSADPSLLPPPDWDEFPLNGKSVRLPAGCRAYFIAALSKDGTKWSSPLYLT